MIIRNSYSLSRHITGSKGMGWPSSFRASPVLPPPLPFFLASQVLSLTGYQKFISLEQNYNHV